MDDGPLLYGFEQAEDALGEGKDFYTNRDDVYQVRFGEDAVTSMYREDGDWSVTVRWPVVDDEDAFDRFHSVAGRLHDTYDVEAARSVLQFRTELDEDGMVADGEDAIDLRYRPQHALDRPSIEVPLSRREKLKEYASWTGTGTGFFGGGGAVVGGGAGAIVGAATGDPVLGVAATGAMAVGGGLGALGGLGGILGAREEIEEKGEERLTPRTTYEEVSASSMHSPLHDVFWRLNERNCLAAALNQVPDHEEGRIPAYDEELIARHEKLEESDLEYWKDAAMDLLFYEAPSLKGVSVSYDAESYEAVRTFLDTVTDAQPADEEPHLYTARSQFSQILRSLTRDEVADALRGDARRMVENVLQQDDAPEEVTAWLEDEHPDLVEEAGQRHALEGA